MNETTLLGIVLTLVWLVLFWATMRSLGSRLTDLVRELRGCRRSLEQLAASTHEESVANARLRKPVEPDDDFLSGKK
jgi:hypothetical protein